MAGKKMAFNPFLPLRTYIPDGEPHVFGDRVYLYGSHDMEGGNHFCMLDYECWSAPVNDLSDWRNEGIIYRAEQCPHYSKEREDMYAPDVVQGIDRRYYLYYDLAGRKGHGFDGPISVAVCDTPAGKYEYYGDVHYPDGRPLKRYIPFDPAVLNDNGRIYLTYGWGLGMDTHAFPLNLVMPRVMSSIFNKTISEIRAEEPTSILGANIVELEADMLTVKSEPKRILPALNNAPKRTDLRKHSFYEAASLRKFGDLYYFIYSSHAGHELCYATSRYPDHGYEYRGVIISNGDIGYHGREAKDRLAPTSTNHGSLEKIGDSYYIFYHRQTHNTAFSRQACAEKVNIERDGTIHQVEITSCGLNGEPIEPEGVFPAAICCNLTNGRMPHFSNVKKNPPAPNINHDAEHIFVKDITDGTCIGYKYFHFDGTYKILAKLRGAAGSLTISTELQGNSIAALAVTGSRTWSTTESGNFTLHGIYPLYFSYCGHGKADFLEFEIFKVL